MKILIVDDEYYNVLLLKELLEKNYEVLVAGNGRQAIEQAKKHTPDLILLDIIMPEMDGYETLSLLKEDPTTHHIHVIMVTAKVEKEDVKKAFVNGASDYIKKPVDLTELLYKANLYNELTKKQHAINKYKEYYEMHEGILYAQHIQRSLLPDKDHLEFLFPDSFSLYMPKSFISGDFYFVSRIGGKKFICLFDCTGHGIPAGMSSVIGFMILEKLVNQQRITEPLQVAGLLRDELIGLLSRTSDVYSKNLFSMDALFCEISDGNVLKYVGAKRPLVVVRQNNEKLLVDEAEIIPQKSQEQNHLFMIKGCKQSIDIEARSYSYNTREVHLLEGDKIYLYSDGYGDQMGGKNNKKFGVKNLLSEILQMQQDDIRREKHMLFENLMRHKGQQEQTDDIVLLGLQV